MRPGTPYCASTGGAGSGDAQTSAGRSGSWSASAGVRCRSRAEGRSRPGCGLARERQAAVLRQPANAWSRISVRIPRASASARTSSSHSANDGRAVSCGSGRVPAPIVSSAHQQQEHATHRISVQPFPHPASRDAGCAQYHPFVRALIVEDDQTIADFVARGLREAGFAVDHAADGEEGLAGRARAALRRRHRRPDAAASATGCR